MKRKIAAVLGILLVTACVFSCGFVAMAYYDNQSGYEYSLSDSQTRQAEALPTFLTVIARVETETPVPTRTLTETMEMAATATALAALPSPIPTPSATPEPSNRDGSSLTLAAPLDTPVEATDVTLRILEVARPAGALIAAGSENNQTAAEGYHFMLIHVEIECMLAEEEVCQVTPATDFQAYGSENTVYRPITSTVGIEDILTNTEFLGGSTINGFIGFEVGEAETDLVLRYASAAGFTNPVYLDLSTSTDTQSSQPERQPTPLAATTNTAPATTKETLFAV